MSNKKEKKKELKLHFRRFEFKYLIPKDTSDRLIPQLLDYMDWDPYVITNDYYEVNSLYYDSPGFKNYYEKVSGLLNRRKPRIRMYFKDLEKNKYIFFEIKKKFGDVIIKERIAVTLDQYKQFKKDNFSVLNMAGIDKNFYNEFLYELSKFAMKPVVLVSYKRKPLVAKNNSRFRVTFDYDIEAARSEGFSFEADYEPVYPGVVVLEVKYNGDMPYWFSNIIQEYKLDRQSFSKYCQSVNKCYRMAEEDELNFYAAGEIR